MKRKASYDEHDGIIVTVLEWSTDLFQERTIPHMLTFCNIKTSKKEVIQLSLEVVKFNILSHFSPEKLSSKILHHQVQFKSTLVLLV